MIDEDKLEILHKLIEQHTRCEIMARLGPMIRQTLSNSDKTKAMSPDPCWAYKMVELLDEIRELVFGTNDILELGLKWGILKDYKKKAKSQQQKIPPMPKIKK